MTIPDLSAIASDFTQKHFLEKARDNMYPKILEAMQIGASIQAQQVTNELQKLKAELVESRRKANAPQ